MQAGTRNHGSANANGDKRLEELMLYIADRCENDPYFGSTKLNKVLFLSDMFFYAQTGETITGAEYQRLPFGPAPRRMVPVLERLQTEQRGYMRTRQTSIGTQKRLVALADPDLSMFSGEQIAQVEKVLRLVQNQKANELSDTTHRDATWRFARDGETINPNAIFISQEPLSRSEMALGLAAAKEQGLA